MGIWSVASLVTPPYHAGKADTLFLRGDFVLVKNLILVLVHRKYENIGETTDSVVYSAIYWYY